MGVDRDWLMNLALVVLHHDVVFADGQDVESLVEASDGSDRLTLHRATLPLHLSIVEIPDTYFAILMPRHHVGVSSGKVD